MAFGDMMRERRRQLRLGLREFALRAEVDASNLSKMERGVLPPPQEDDLLNRICAALELTPGSPECLAFSDQAAAERGRLPSDILEDEELLSRLPVLLRTVKNKRPTEEQLDRLIEIIREA
jgi:transcriptional regulator with XRE-family HTH domain